MRRIDNLSGAPRQKTVVVLDDGQEVTLSLYYLPAPQRWQLDLVYQDFEIKGIQLTIHPNFLRQWRGKLPFGLACGAEDGVDPIYATDFGDARCNLYILDAADVVFVEQVVIGHPE